ncbi:hypothetical protein AAHV36_04380 [Klebsiella pneumoniae]|nr:hypothetical protein [Klebsiella pneumoniae]
MAALNKKETELLFKLAEYAGVEVWEYQDQIVKEYLQELIERLEAE